MSEYGASVQIKESGFVTFRALTQCSRKVNVTRMGHSYLIRLWETIKMLTKPPATAVIEIYMVEITSF